MGILFRRLGPAFQLPCKRPNPTSARDRWRKLAIVPPIQLLNETSSNLLEYLLILPLTHVRNLARCSIVWNAKNTIPRSFAKKGSRAVRSNFCAVLVFDRTFLVSLASLADFYPNARIKWPWGIGAPPIPD